MDFRKQNLLILRNMVTDMNKFDQLYSENRAFKNKVGHIINNFDLTQSIFFTILEKGFEKYDLYFK